MRSYTRSSSPPVGRLVFLLSAAVAAFLGTTPEALSSDCELEWSDQFPPNTFDGLVNAMAVFDDGSGPALYVGGAFTHAGGVAADRIARWDGVSFSVLGRGLNGTVFALATFDDDGPGPNRPQLYAAGSFTSAGEVMADRIARWDGTRWAAAGLGLNNVAYALFAWEEGAAAGLYVGGMFTFAGATAANRIARWNGTTWSALGSGFNSYVNAIVAFDDDGSGPRPAALYAGGGFTKSGTNDVRRVARWDGTSWLPLKANVNEEDGVSGVVNAMTTFDPDGSGPLPQNLYLGGEFAIAGRTVVNRIVAWSRTGEHMAWVPLRSGVDDVVVALATYDPDGTGPEPAALYAGGLFTRADGLLVNHVARWDGAAWAELTGGTDNLVASLRAFDDDGVGPYLPALYAGGNFAKAGGIPAGRFARWGCPLTNAPPVIVEHPRDQAVCAGGEANFRVSAWGTRPLSFQWRKDGQDIFGATSNRLQIKSVGPEDVGAYDVVVRNDFGTATSNAALLSLANPPEIITQPVSRSACVGGKATFEVTATGQPPLRYQWYHDDLMVFGATDPILVIDPVKNGSAGTYTVKVGNDCGNVTSAPAVLLVFDGGPEILEPPRSVTVCDGQKVTFKVTARGQDPLRYQWLHNGRPINGATEPEHTISKVTFGDAGAYSVIVTDNCGATTSPEANLGVSFKPTIIEHPQSQRVCEGGDTRFEVRATGDPPLTFQWRKDGRDVHGATSAVLLINGADPNDAGTYEVVVRNNCGAVTSNPALLKVDLPPEIEEQPQPQVACDGGAAVFQVRATGAEPLTYQWRKGAVNIPGATGSKHIVNPVGKADAGSYDVVIANSCGSVTSAAATLTVHTTPLIEEPPQSQGVCEGVAVEFRVRASGYGPITYQWRKNGVNIDGFTGETLRLDPVRRGDAGQYDVLVTNPCGTTVSPAALLTVNVGPVIVRQPESRGVCEGSPAEFSVEAGGHGPFTYQWRKDGQNIPGAMQSRLRIDIVGSKDAGWYDVAVSGPCGTTLSAAAELVVGRGPVILEQPQSQRVCERTAVAFAVRANGSEPLSYEWRKDGVPLPGGDDREYWVDPVAPQDAGRYEVVVRSPCGDVLSSPATLVVDTFPSITQQPSSGTACVGSPFVLRVVATGTEPLAYRWEKDGVPIQGAVGAALVFGAVAAEDAGRYRAVAQNHCGTVVSQDVALAVLAKPTILKQPESRTVCIGAAVELDVSATGDDQIEYQWRRGGQNLPDTNRPRLRIESAATSDAGTYEVVVTGRCGSVRSQAARLAVEDCTPLPDVPGSPAPADGATGQPLSLDLRWTSNGATAYELYLGETAEPTLFATTVTPQHGVKGLKPGVVYHWRVVASNPRGSRAGPLWRFTTTAVAGVVEPLPDENAGLPPSGPPGGNIGPSNPPPGQPGGSGNTPLGSAGSSGSALPDRAEQPPGEDLQPAGCGAGCGASYMAMMPLMAAWLTAAKAVRRRPTPKE